VILAASVPERCATGTSLAAIGITALAGTILYGLEGDVDVDLGYAALVGLPAAAGAVAGSSLQQRVSVRALSLAFAALLAGIAVARGCGRLEWSVLDWNEPSIAFYRSLGATALDDWTTYRLTGDSLAMLASTSAIRSK